MKEHDGYNVPAPDPNPRDEVDFRPRKSQYGRQAPIRIDRNTRARDRTLAEVRWGGKLQYGKDGRTS